MEVFEYLALVSNKRKIINELTGEPVNIYESKYDNSYLTMEGQECVVEYLAKREITEQLTTGVGFSPKEGKWYGWSHRAIYGFGVGSTCKKGDCHYVASTPEELIEDYVNFYAEYEEDEVQMRRKECQILPDRSGIRILPSPLEVPVAKNADELLCALGGDLDLEKEDIFRDSFYELKCGKGEWVAKTMEDAKKMAEDFNRGVS